MKQPVLTLLSGIPRSGKSTWVAKNQKETDVVVSPDTIRLVIFGHQFHKNAEPFIWSFTDAFILLLAKQKKSIILDAVNMGSHIRHKYASMVKPYGYKVKLVWINTTLAECLKRNKKSKDKKVPVNVIEGMAAGFSPINAKYETDFDEIIEVRNGRTIKIK